MKAETCENCRYYNEGECRRFPPQIWETTETGGSNFPRIDKKGWCGEFFPNQPEIKEENGILYARMTRPVRGWVYKSEGDHACNGGH